MSFIIDFLHHRCLAIFGPSF